MDEVPASNVRLVDVVKVRLPDNVTVLAPSLISRTLLLLDDKIATVTL